MSEPIKHEDIIQIEKTLAGINKIIKQLRVLQNEMKKTAKDVIAFQQKQDPGTASGKTGTKQASDQTSKLVKQNEKLAKSIKEVTAEQVRLKRQQKDMNTEMRRQVQIMGAAKGSLDRNRVALQKLSERYAKAGPDAARKMESRVVSLTNKIKAQEAAIGRHQRNVGNYKSAFGGALKAAKSFGAGMIGVSAAISGVSRMLRAAKEASEEFESSFVTVLTLLDKAQIKEFGGMLEKGADQIIKQFGLEAEDVNKALFDAISAGVGAGEAIEFLTAAAKLAVGGNAQLSDVVLGTTKIMNAYNLEASDATKISQALFAAQKVGQTTVGELSASVGTATGIAQQAGISYDELLATFAVLTKRLKNTDETATAITATITALINPGKEAADVFKSVGIESGIAALRQNGLFETLVQIVGASEENVDVLTELIPNIRALKGVGALTAEALLEYDETMKLINDDTGAAVLLQDAYNMQMDTHAKTMAVRKEKMKSQLRQEKDLNFFQRIAVNLMVKRIDLTENEEIPAIEDTTQANTELLDVQKKLDEIEAKRQKRINDRLALEARQKTLITDANKNIAKFNTDLYFAEQEFIALLALEEQAYEDSISAAMRADEQDKKLKEGQTKRHQKYLDWKKKQDEQEEEDRRRGRETVLNETANTLFSLTDLKMAKLDQEKAAEIEAAEGNKIKIAAIEKKYAKEQQKLDTKRALIDASLAILKTLSSVVFPFNVIAAAMIAAQAGIQVAAIKSQTFAKGGHGELGGERHSQGGTYLPGIGEAEKGEYFGIINRQMTRKYSHDLPMIFDSLNKGKFHDVWSNANIQLQENIDPWTKRMYDLMARTPTTYTDSNGDTVKEYPDGNIRIIRKA